MKIEVFHGSLWDLPSGRRLHNYGKSLLRMGKTMSIHYFGWAILNYLWNGTNDRNQDKNVTGLT